MSDAMTTEMPMSKERPILFSAPMIRAILAGTKTQTRRLVTTREPLDFLGGRGQEDDPTCWGWFFDGPEQHGYMVLGRGLDERHDHGSISIPSPYGEPGDRLWVRETWAVKIVDPNEYLYGPLTSLGIRAYGGASPTPGCHLRARTTDAMVVYSAHPTSLAELRISPGYTTYRTDAPDAWRPSIFMPRWASRITLEIVDVRVQRLQEISEDDAQAEGISFDGRWHLGAKHPIKGTPKVFPTARQAFESHWDRINGERRRREWLEPGDPGYTVDRPWRTVVDTSARWSANPWVWAVTFKRVEQP